VQAKELEQYAKATVGAVLATKEAKRLKAEKAAAEAFFNSPDSDVSVDPNAVIAAEADAANHPINGPVAPADDKPKSRKSK
ncbi:MAG TPA: hypothetical protein VFH39_04155, partial [Candidatus Saccharimonadales bacterium]|nr:hypothetical protein [Candidatus Saccharimonadales bacterium]